MFTEDFSDAGCGDVCCLSLFLKGIGQKRLCFIQTGEFVAHLLVIEVVSGKKSDGWHYFFIISKKILHEALSVYSGNTTVNSMGIRYFLLFLGSTQAFVADAGCCGWHAGIYDLPQVCYCRTADGFLIHLFSISAALLLSQI
ncbi:MAG: hypothetical protein KA821_03180 [Chitinophagaceae bacterium]|nr:hypothetical protein [Chitinophagaceae bacterium]